MIVGAHDAGPLIRSKNGFWLAIPTPAAGKALGGRRITPAAWERKTGLRLRFVYRRTGPSLLVADSVRLNARGHAAVSRSKTGRSQVTAPMFLLVPQVKLPKRLDLARDAARAHDDGAGADRGELGGGAAFDLGSWSGPIRNLGGIIMQRLTQRKRGRGPSSPPITRGTSLRELGLHLFGGRRKPLTDRRGDVLDGSSIDFAQPGRLLHPAFEGTPREGSLLLE